MTWLRMHWGDCHQDKIAQYEKKVATAGSITEKEVEYLKSVIKSHEKINDDLGTLITELKDHILHLTEIVLQEGYTGLNASNNQKFPLYYKPEAEPAKSSPLYTNFIIDSPEKPNGAAKKKK